MMLRGFENPVHLLFILVVAALVLGPKRLPGIGRSVGAGIREFRDSISAGEDEGHDSLAIGAIGATSSR